MQASSTLSRGAMVSSLGAAEDIIAMAESHLLNEHLIDEDDGSLLLSKGARLALCRLLEMASDELRTVARTLPLAQQP